MRRKRFQIVDGSIASFVHRDREFSFVVHNKHDSIQGCHYNGFFYDLPGLEIIEHHVKPGGTFLDIGSNVGNHAVYAAAFCGVARIILIEPNPPAIRLLHINLALNGLASAADVRFLGIGLSDANGHASVTTPVDNLGGTYLSSDTGDGRIPLQRGDTLLREERIGFVKIDVERMELQVLSGLQDVIERCRPPMFIEVDDANLAGFHRFLEANAYRIGGRHRLHLGNENFLVEPVETPAV